MTRTQILYHQLKPFEHQQSIVGKPNCDNYCILVILPWLPVDSLCSTPVLRSRWARCGVKLTKSETELGVWRVVSTVESAAVQKATVAPELSYEV